MCGRLGAPNGRIWPRSLVAGKPPSVQIGGYVRTGASH
jgi:hypothetical protein